MADNQDELKIKIVIDNEEAIKNTKKVTVATDDMIDSFLKGIVDLDEKKKESTEKTKKQDKEVLVSKTNLMEKELITTKNHKANILKILTDKQNEIISNEKAMYMSMYKAEVEASNMKAKSDAAYRVLYAKQQKEKLDDTLKMYKNMFIQIEKNEKEAAAKNLKMLDEAHAEDKAFSAKKLALEKADTKKLIAHRKERIARFKTAEKEMLYEAEALNKIYDIQRAKELSEEKKVAEEAIAIEKQKNKEKLASQKAYRISYAKEKEAQHKADLKMYKDMFIQIENEEKEANSKKVILNEKLSKEAIARKEMYNKKEMSVTSTHKDKMLIIKINERNKIMANENLLYKHMYNSEVEYYKMKEALIKKEIAAEKAKNKAKLASVESFNRNKKVSNAKVNSAIKSQDNKANAGFFFNMASRVKKVASYYSAYMIYTGILRTATSAFRKFVDVTVETESALRKLNTIAKLSNENLYALGETLRNVGIETGNSFKDVLAGAYEGLSTGIPTEEIVKFTKVSATLAKAGFTTVQNATKSLTTIMSSYGLGIEDATRVGDIFIASQIKGRFTLDQLSGSLSKVIPIASAAGVSFQAVASAMAQLTLDGNTTAKASTQLARLISELEDHGSKLSEILVEKTGHSFRYLMADGKSLSDVIAIISKEMDTTGKTAGELTESIRSKNALISLAKEGGYKYAKSLEEISKQQNTMKKSAEEVQKDLETSFTKLSSVIDKLFWNERVKQNLTNLTNGVTKLLDDAANYNNYKALAKETMEKILGVDSNSFNKLEQTRVDYIAGFYRKNGLEAGKVFSKALIEGQSTEDAEFTASHVFVSDGKDRSGSSEDGLIKATTPEEAMAIKARQQLKTEHGKRMAAINLKYNSLINSDDEINTEVKTSLLKQQNKELLKEQLEYYSNTEGMNKEKIATEAKLEELRLADIIAKNDAKLTEEEKFLNKQAEVTLALKTKLSNSDTTEEDDNIKLKALRVTQLNDLIKFYEDKNNIKAMQSAQTELADIKLGDKGGVEESKTEEKLLQEQRKIALANIDIFNNAQLQKQIDYNAQKLANGIIDETVQKEHDDAFALQLLEEKAIELAKYPILEEEQRQNLLDIQNKKLEDMKEAADKEKAILEKKEALKNKIIAVGQNSAKSALTNLIKGESLKIKALTASAVEEITIYAITQQAKSVLLAHEKAAEGVALASNPLTAWMAPPVLAAAKTAFAKSVIIGAVGSTAINALGGSYSGEDSDDDTSSSSSATPEETVSTVEEDEEDNQIVILQGAEPFINALEREWNDKYDFQIRGTAKRKRR